jgi:predicted nucleotidyltransferase
MEKSAFYSQKYREGDFIETTEGLIFDVKGIVHPIDRVIAFIRYVPDPQGDRIRCNQRYRKIYNLTHRYHYLQQMYPHYLRYDPVFDMIASQVTHKSIHRHYRPQNKVHELMSETTIDPFQKQTVEFIKKITQIAHVPQSTLGVSGSILVNLYSSNSDIDLIVYGTRAAHSVRTALLEHFEGDDDLTTYPHSILKHRFFERQSAAGISFQKYVFHESRKTFQGYYNEKDFFIRYVKNWDETNVEYGDYKYTNKGVIKLRGVIADDTEAIFTPCTYNLTDVEVLEGLQAQQITEITSFRGRFCDQAVKGEQIEARGKLEKVVGHSKTYYRLLLGNMLQDYMIRL